MDYAVREVLKKPWMLPTLIGAGAFACGVGAGFFAGTRRRKTDIIYIEKDPQMTLFDSKGEPRHELSSQTNVAEPTDGEAIPAKEEKPRFGLVIDASDREALELTVDNKPMELTIDTDTPRINVFEQNDSEDWNWEEELSSRKKHEPYVIHFNEYDVNESEYDQETLTYYVKDEVVADQSDTPIYAWFGMMGDLKFGHGSPDPDAVYIRNDSIRMEWEILRNNGSFEEEVLGFEIEEQYETEDLKHSSPVKFRDD